MAAALEQLAELRYSTKLVSMYESFLAAKWLETANRYPDPSVGDTNDAVNALFLVAPGDALGRIGPFRWEWKSGQDSGRKTVWNNTTRGTKLATTIFQPRPPAQAGAPGDIRGGLRPNAATLVGAELQALPVPGWQALAALVLRDYEFAPGDDPLSQGCDAKTSRSGKDRICAAPGRDENNAAPPSPPKPSPCCASGCVSAPGHLTPRGSPAAAARH